jgi:diguanylate cyclase
MQGRPDPVLALISIGIAILASYTALGLAGRVAAARAGAGRLAGGGSLALPPGAEQTAGAGGREWSAPATCR